MDSEELVLEDSDINLGGNLTPTLVDKVMEDSIVSTMRKISESNSRPCAVIVSSETIKKLTNTQIIFGQDMVQFRTIDPVDGAHFSNITKALTTSGWENWRQSCIEQEFILKIKFNSKKQIKI